MQRDLVQTIIAFFVGAGHVFAWVFVLSILIVWALQSVAIGLEESYDWGAVLWQLFLSLSFMAFYPGQGFWTYKYRDRSGRVYVIIGQPDQVE